MTKWLRLGSWLAKAGFVVGVTVLSWFSVPAATVAICAIILVALHAKAGTLIELSFGPLRAKLERELSEAEKLVNKLRSFAALQAKTVIAASSRTGRWPDETDDWQFANLRAVEAALRDMGASEDELREARSDLVRLTILDLGNAALGNSRVPMKLGNEAVEEWQAIKREGRHASPDVIEAYLTKWNALTVDRQGRIEDMRWIIEHGDIRDREQYLRAHTEIVWD